MRKSRFTEEQVIGILREHEAGVKTADVCRKHGVSSAMFYIYGRLSRCKRSDQRSGELGCQHLSGVARDAGVPK